MSYDLFFHRQPGVPPEALRAWFDDRPHHTTDQWPEVFYGNELTGVYFSFDFEGEGAVQSGSFNLNSYRPPTFGLEAAPELAAFVAQFGFGVEDPQDEGMDEGPFTVEGFLRGWNAGNLFGHRAILSRDDVQPLTLPQATLEACWRWNHDLEQRREAMGESVYVGRVYLLRHEDRAATAVIWTDAIASVFPRVDLVVAYADELAPRRWLLRQTGTRVLPWSALEALPAVEPGDDGKAWVRVAHQSPEAVSLFRGLGPPEQLDGLRPDQVLAAELVEAARG